MKHTRLTEHITRSMISDIPATPMPVSWMRWLVDVVCAGTMSRVATISATGMDPACIMGCSLEMLRYSLVNC